MARTVAKQVKPADQITANWVAGMQSPNAQNKYKQGIANYQGNPMAQAASPAALDKYVRHVQESVASGKRAASLNAADPALWKTNAMTVGAPGLGAGALKKKAKHAKRMQGWQPIYQQASNAAAAVPDDGNINQGKWAAAAQAMKAAKGKV
jgi:hypothetical protein